MDATLRHVTQRGAGGQKVDGGGGVKEAADAAGVEYVSRE